LFIPGGTYFFTVALEDRRRKFLTDNIDALRRAYAYVRERHPFETAAIVVCPIICIASGPCPRTIRIIRRAGGC